MLSETIESLLPCLVEEIHKRVLYGERVSWIIENSLAGPPERL
jgi:hypothetical protein